MGVMIRNYWSTILGVLLGIGYYLQASGMKMPETKQEWWSMGIGVLLAGLGIVSKDATTGSAPGQGAGKGPLMRSFLVALALPTLLLAGCASSDIAKGLVISGTTLKAIGHEFADTAAAFKTGCDARTIAVDKCRKFGEFEKLFKRDYPLAVAAWKRALGTGAAGDTEAQVLGMALDLGVFATQVGVLTVGGQ